MQKQTTTKCAPTRSDYHTLLLTFL